MVGVAELKRSLGIVEEPPMASLDNQIPVTQKWEEALNNLKDLSIITVKENVELSRRVAQLEEELQVWKQARSVTIDKAEREKSQYEEEIKQHQRRISVLESMQESMVLCVLDGDGNIFADHLLKAGLEGGREAARNLTDGIGSYLNENGYEGHSRCTLWLSIYFNKKGLQDTLVRSGVCSADQFEAFIVGISQASPRFLLVDVGYGKEAADSKIKEYLQTYTRFPQTLKVFFGGGHDNGYLPTLAALENERLLQKIVLLKGYHDIATELKHLDLPTLTLDNLFRSAKIVNTPSPYSRIAASPAPTASDVVIFPPALNLNVPSLNGGSPAPNGITQTAKKQINPSLPLSKQNPPPCNEFYLLKRCPRLENCKYGHEYELTPEQLSEISKYAKHTPCFSVRNGTECAFGTNCIWGHICPKGPKCFRVKQGKCWFGDAEAHAQTEGNGISGHSPGASIHSYGSLVESSPSSIQPPMSAAVQSPGVAVPDRGLTPPPGLSSFNTSIGALDQLNFRVKSIIH